MHELSIARSLIDLACERAEREGGSRIRVIRIRLGVLSGLMKPLCFCFAAASRGTLCEGARLEIEEVPLTLACPTCRMPRAPTSLHSFRCTVCGSPAPRVVTGREMHLVALELDENARAPAGRRRPRGSAISQRPESRQE